MLTEAQDNHWHAQLDTANWFVQYKIEKGVLVTPDTLIALEAERQALREIMDDAKAYVDLCDAIHNDDYTDINRAVAQSHDLTLLLDTLRDSLAAIAEVRGGVP